MRRSRRTQGVNVSSIAEEPVLPHAAFAAATTPPEAPTVEPTLEATPVLHASDTVLQSDAGPALTMSEEPAPKESIIAILRSVAPAREQRAVSPRPADRRLGRRSLAVAGTAALGLTGLVQLGSAGVAAAAPAAAPGLAPPAGSNWPACTNKEAGIGGSVFGVLKSPTAQPGQTVLVATYTDESPINTTTFVGHNGVTQTPPQWGVTSSAGTFTAEPASAISLAPNGSFQNGSDLSITIPSTLTAGTYTGWLLGFDTDGNKAGGDCGIANFTITITPPPTQSLAGHFFQCTNGAATSTEIPGGTMTGSQAGQSNVTVTPAGVSVPVANTWRVDAAPPAGFQLASCTNETAATGGAFPTVTSPSAANENVVVPSGGTGTANFYVTPITQSITGQIINCATNQEAGNGTLRASGPSNEQVPAGGGTQADPMNGATVQHSGDWTMFATAPTGTQFVTACGQAGNGVSASQTKTVPSGGSQTFTFFVTPNPNNPTLSLTKTANVSTVTAGNSFNWTLVAHNGGPGDATHAVVSDPVPNGLTINGTPSTTQGSCSVSGQNVTCNLGTLAANTSATIVINVTATGTVCGPIINTGTLTTDQGTTQGSASVTVNCPNFNINLQKSASVGNNATITAGTSFTYTLVATNTGAAAATGVVVTDAIPSQLTINGTPTSTQGSCSVSGNNVTCNVGTLAANNGSATITINVGTSTSSCGAVNNMGQVSATGGTTGNSNTVTTNIVCPETLGVTVGVVKTNNAQDPTGTDYGKVETAQNLGETFNYQAVITNTSTVTEVIGTITDTIAGQPIQDVCASLVNQTLAPQASVTCTFQGVAPNTPGSSLTDTVTVPVSQQGTPTNTGTGTDTSTVNTGPGVIITKASNADGSGFGQNETVAKGSTSVPYQVTVSNPNSSPGTITSLTDTIDGNVSNICPDLVGKVLAPKGQPDDSVVCNFTTTVPTSVTTDTAAVNLSVNGVVVPGSAQTTVFPPVLGTQITPATPAPAALAFTGPRAPIGKMLGMAIGMIALGLLFLVGLQVVDGRKRPSLRFATVDRSRPTDGGQVRAKAESRPRPEWRPGTGYYQVTATAAAATWVADRIRSGLHRRR